MNKSLSIFIAASGMGALSGMLCGLSSSPVVASVLGALIPLSVGFITWFSLKLSTNIANPRYYIAAVTGFSWAALIAVMFGLMIRTNNWLSPKPAKLVAEWKAAGFPNSEVRAIVKTLLTTSADLDTEAKTDSSLSGLETIRQSILFGDTTSISEIRLLQRIVENGDITVIKDNFTKTGGLLKAAVKHISEIETDEAKQLQFLQNFYKTLLRADS